MYPFFSLRFIKTEFKQKGLYLQPDFITFMHSFLTFFISQAKTNFSGTQNLWGAPDFSDAHILRRRKEKETIELKIYSDTCKLL